MDIVTVDLYESIDNNMYMKILEGFKMSATYNLSLQEVYPIKLQKSLQTLNKEYNNDLICPCVFIKKSESEFAIIVVYVDDLNIIRTHEEIPNIIKLR